MTAFPTAPHPVPMRQALVDYVCACRLIYMDAKWPDDLAEYNRYSRAFGAFHSRYGDSPFAGDDRPTPHRAVYLAPEREKR